MEQSLEIKKKKNHTTKSHRHYAEEITSHRENILYAFIYVAQGALRYGGRKIRKFATPAVVMNFFSCCITFICVELIRGRLWEVRHCQCAETDKLEPVSSDACVVFLQLIAKVLIHSHCLNVRFLVNFPFDNLEVHGLLAQSGINNQTEQRNPNVQIQSLNLIIFIKSHCFQGRMGIFDQIFLIVEVMLS